MSEDKESTSGRMERAGTNFANAVEGLVNRKIDKNLAESIAAYFATEEGRELIRTEVRAYLEEVKSNQ